MAARPKIAFVGAGSTVFMKNLVSDILQRPALAEAHIALMDIDAQRLAESELVAQRLAEQLAPGATISTHSEQAAAVDGSDFVIVCFQIGGYKPCTVTDFEIPKKYGLRQTIADTLGIGGIMRGLRTVPHLWKLCEDMQRLCPDAIMLQYVNPMAINCWAIAERFPAIRHVGLCHSVEHTAAALADDLEIDQSSMRYRVAGINHLAFFLGLEQVLTDGTHRDLYPMLRKGYQDGSIPKPNPMHPNCPNKVRYEMMMRLGYFVTESSEHFAEYVPWFIKSSKPDLLDRFGIPLDEYPRRCIKQQADWKAQLEQIKKSASIATKQSQEYASAIANAVVTGEPAVIYGNVPNAGLINSLPEGCCVEVPCLVDRNGIQPTPAGDLPPQLTALMRSNVSVQELTVRALVEEKRDYIYHAAMMDPHTAAELDIDNIWAMVDDLLLSHGKWLPTWLNRPD